MQPGNWGSVERLTQDWQKSFLPLLNGRKCTIGLIPNNYIIHKIFRCGLLKKYVAGINILESKSILSVLSAANNIRHKESARNSAWQAYFFVAKYHEDPEFQSQEDVDKSVLDRDLLIGAFVSTYII